MHSSAPLYLWLATGALLLGLMAVDLAALGRRKGPVSVRTATVWVLLYVGLACLFGCALLAMGRGESGTEFFAGYITEYSLSVDNLFVFVLIMSRFDVPSIAQEKVLLIGIVLSFVLRAAFILAGTALIAAASWTFCIFGVLLVYTAWQLVAGGDDEEDFQEYRPVRALRRVLPLSDSYSGSRLRVLVDGRPLWTPLALSIAAITIANFVFALDSMPAIFGLTQDTFVILTANAFALLGLRQLYFLIDGLLDRLAYLKYGLAAILGFIGLKLIEEGLIQSGVEHIGSWRLPEIGIGPSLGFIGAVLVVAALASSRKTRSGVRTL